MPVSACNVDVIDVDLHAIRSFSSSTNSSWPFLDYHETQAQFLKQEVQNTDRLLASDDVSNVHRSILSHQSLLDGSLNL